MQWEAVTAISVAIMALVWLLLAFNLMAWMRARRRTWQALDRFAELLDREVGPALSGVREVVDDTREVVRSVREEAREVVDLSRELRGRVEERVREVEAVLDVLLEELEDTVLDLAAVLRATRRGGSVVRAFKGAVLGRGR